MFCKCKCHCWVWRMIDSLYYSSQKIRERCENSFVSYTINYQKLCYSLRRIWTQPVYFLDIGGMRQWSHTTSTLQVNTRSSQVPGLSIVVHSCSRQWVPWTHPYSRVVNDSTPSRHRILRYINFGIGESSPYLFLNMLNLYLVKFEVNLERAFYCFIILFIWKWILKKEISLVNLHPTLFSRWWILTQLL